MQNKHCHRVTTHFQLINIIIIIIKSPNTDMRGTTVRLLHSFSFLTLILINRLTPNDPYMGRTAPLTSKRCILYTYSTNIGTEHFKHALYSPFFFSSKCSLFHNANLFGSCIIHISYTGCAKIKKKKIIPAPKG